MPHQTCRFMLAALLGFLIACGPVPPPAHPDPDVDEPVVPTTLPYWDLTLTVLDQQTTQPLAGALVRVLPEQGDQTERLTDGEGFAHLSRRQGETTITVSRDGYESWTLRFDLLQRTHKVVGLQPRPPPPPPPPPPPLGRRGLVRGDGSVFVDDDGPFNALGASFFWLAWGVKHDLSRTEANLKFLSDRGVDYIRALGVVGPSHGWEDRTIDPRWPDYDDLIARATDLAYDRYGLRVQWTIFGATDLTPSRATRENLMDRFAQMAVGRAQKIFAFEAANEGWQNGFDGAAGRDELRALARRLVGKTQHLVAVTSPQGDDCVAQASWYTGVGSLVTVHFDRNISLSDGVWRPVRQPWREAQFTCGDVARLYSSNEPIGPFSSVAAEDDPLRLTMNAAVSYLAGVGAYVLHAGPGIRGGGAEDVKRGRPPNWWEVPKVQQTFDGIAVMRRLLPSNLANWHKVNGHWPEFPFDGVKDAVEHGRLIRAYGAVGANGQFVVVILGLRQSVNLTARHAMAITLYDPLTGAVLADRVLAGGEPIEIRDRQALVMIVARREGQW